MTAPIWQLEKHSARLGHEPLSWQVDLLRPQAGLRRIGDPTNPLAGASLLGVTFPSSGLIAAEQVVEKYARGPNLTVAYHPTPTWPVRVDVSWRSLAPPTMRPFVAGVELVVSVCTDQLEARPELIANSEPAAEDVLRLADAGANRFTPVEPRPSLELGRDGGPGCLLFRPPGAAVSYAEMIHPADFHRDELSGGPADLPSQGGKPAPRNGPPLRLRHQLFPQGLEKGVILRARLRGILCRRDDDAAVAADAYRTLAAAEPLLGT